MGSPPVTWTSLEGGGAATPSGLGFLEMLPSNLGEAYAEVVPPMQPHGISYSQALPWGDDYLPDSALALSCRDCMSAGLWGPAV